MAIVSNGTAAVSHLVISVVLSKIIFALTLVTLIRPLISSLGGIDALILIRVVNLIALVLATVVSALLIKKILSYPSRAKVARISAIIMFVFLGLLAAYSINMYFNYSETGSLYEIVKVEALYRTIGGLVTTLMFYFISKKIL